MARTVDLSSDRWLVRAVGDDSAAPAPIRGLDIPAEVPGCIHTDLIRAGLIPDPVVGFNELEVQWIGMTDWEYRLRFDADGAIFEHERIELVCDGLDTIAELRLNGVTIGSAANMFHPHRFDARQALRPGENELSITFRSPLRHIRAEEARLGARPVNGDWDPYIFIRKSACNFGWDWAPKVATSGIWMPIRLEAWSGVRIAGVRPQTRRDGDRWTVDSHVDLEWSGEGTTPPGLLLGACLRDDHHVDEWDSCTPDLGQTTATLSIDLDRPRLWWPRGCGDQPLYSLDVALYANNELWGVADGWEGHIGFREVRLRTEADASGSAFTIEVNGRPIFCKGANWGPHGLFPSEITPDRCRERIGQAAAANMNMLRVWGGGIYEHDEFYSECDRLGIMVWQDFMFACACYPEEAPYPALIEVEARHEIARLSVHPSVVLWCGGNECVCGYESWGYAATDVDGPWKKRVGAKSWGAGYFFDLLPRLVTEMDPTRPYWPNSPWSGSEAVTPNDADQGDRHTWDVRAEGYRTIIPRFCSEFGHQSPPNLSTLVKVLRPEDLAIGSAAMHHRQRGTGGMPRHIDECLAEHFPPPKDFAEWHSLGQLMQARALRTGIEWMVANRPRCMGALIWQLNDVWPGMSWSLIDSDGTPKPAYYAVQEAFGLITP